MSKDQKDKIDSHELTDAELRHIIDRLKQFKKEVEKTADDEKYREQIHKCVDEFESKLNQVPRYRRKDLLKKYELEHKFLSQQIDERSHQAWTLGALFVPVSFLIFAQAVLYNPDPAIVPITLIILNKVLLTTLSFLCYFSWLAFYLRTHRLNVYSYPRIHVIEKTLDLSAHLHLDYLRRKYSLRLKPENVFIGLLLILGILYAVHIVAQLIVFHLLVPLIP